MVVKQLQAMLQDAIDGKIFGLIASVHYGANEFSYMASGSMCNCPTIGVTAAVRLKTKLLHANK